MPQLVHIDVSELEPPEPMATVLKSLQQLESDAALRVYHRRQPFPLFKLLDEMGYAYHCIELNYSEFAIYIWLKNEESLHDFCYQAANQELAS
ncbi:DUF2249 domain-containing protein [Motiliproteus sp. MSK22-1]|uniref:DUF2249 domain-containing protein n=1 Tax=Motiliproteus sp. MSK22-1 TaxID=1897630 RepID=UPI000975DBD3|nr:DUF2249 domain-containing protein [Motiliproteus sp. MSK22-1]OMH32758.1 hypothetical protein BGP75_14630 [Motiliproteus sp. MSK22-1]